MIRTAARLAVVASASVTVLALVPATAPAGTIHSTSTSIQFVGYAHLQEDKTALVTVAYQCQPSTAAPTGTVAVGLEQKGGTGIAVEHSARCDDQKHSVTLDVGPGPFKLGTAAAAAEVRNGGFTGGFAQTFAELQVK
jgi:hypothetical protein